jgi:hypothetical protein
MGYSEVHCRLCGVSFNISRIRKQGDPQSDAFKNTGDGLYPGFVDENQGSDCVASDGCSLVRRLVVDTMGQFPSGGEEEQSEQVADDIESRWRGEEDREDGDYIEESSEDENHEYESDDDLVASDQDEDVVMDDYNSGEHQNEWREFLLGKAPDGKIDSATSETQYLPINYLREMGQSNTEKRTGKIRSANIRSYLLMIVHSVSDDGRLIIYEHIAGPACKAGLGYNGNIITAEEMRGCNTFQCLVDKRNINYQLSKYEESDVDYERTSNYFLSGLSNRMPSRDTGSQSSLVPPRHGVTEIVGDNVPWTVSFMLKFLCVFFDTSNLLANQAHSIEVAARNTLCHSIQHVLTYSLASRDTTLMGT